MSNEFATRVDQDLRRLVADVDVVSDLVLELLSMEDIESIYIVQIQLADGLFYLFACSTGDTTCPRMFKNDEILTRLDEGEILVV
jgi:hypothetical protein